MPHQKQPTINESTNQNKKVIKTLKKTLSLSVQSGE